MSIKEQHLPMTKLVKKKDDKVQKTRQHVDKNDKFDPCR